MISDLLVGRKAKVKDFNRYIVAALLTLFARLASSHAGTGLAAKMLVRMRPGPTPRCRRVLRSVASQ